MKTLIDRYISQHVLSAIGVISLMLLGLQLFMLMVGEMNVIGTGSYGLFDAFIYVLLQLPFQLYLFFPVACLLGVLMGLGMMANHCELLVIRASGLSPMNIVWTVFKAVSLLVIMVCLLGEIVFPKLIKFGQELKSNLQTNGQSIQTEHGLWLRQDNSFIHIKHVVSTHQLEDIQQYQFNQKHDLILSRYIKTANHQNGIWHLQGVEETKFVGSKYLRAKSKKIEHMYWQLNLLPNMLMITDSDPNEMSLLKLGRFIMAKRKEHLDAGNFEMNFWRRIFQPLVTFVMVLLAMPFVFGSVRHMSIGQRFLLGAAVGFLFHLLNEFVVPISQIYQVPALMAAAMPMLIFSLLGLVIILKLR